MAMTGIRHALRKGRMCIASDQTGVLPMDARPFADQQFKSWVEATARDWRVLSFDIRQVESGVPDGASVSDGDLGDARLPYPSAWLEAAGWGALATQIDGDVNGLMVFLFGDMPGGKVGMLGFSAVGLDQNGKVQPHRSVPFYDSDFPQFATWMVLAALSHINARTVEVHFHGSVLKERVPPSPHVPLALSSMPVVRLRPDTKLFCESGKGTGEKTYTARKYHPVMAHQRKLNSGKTIRVRSHWRGDPEIGTVRPSYEVA